MKSQEHETGFFQKRLKISNMNLEYKLKDKKRGYKTCKRGIAIKRNIIKV